MEAEEPLYRNFISHMDIDRGINTLECFNFRSVEDEKFFEFKNDIFSNNDAIELNLIKNKAYKEAVILKINKKEQIIGEFLLDEQKTFGGSKLFYLNDNSDKILVMAIPGSLEGKLNMVIQRLNKVNDKIHRLNSKIKKGNFDIYKKRVKMHDKKDKIIDSINKNLRI
jgi:hypothetical protein|tara:strand:+ start:179 stop:682 length:504 start_codon:yes stop_codon:yes gene_type:complete